MADGFEGFGGYPAANRDTAPVRGMPGNRQVNILKVFNGFVVGVGCQQVVFESKTKMLSELSRYFENADAVEKEYLEKK